MYEVMHENLMLLNIPKCYDRNSYIKYANENICAVVDMIKIPVFSNFLFGHPNYE